MEYVPTAIPEVVLLKPKVFGDARGFFLETFRQSEFDAFCGHQDFVQDNHSGSRRGILRGLHYQLRQTQGKLVRAAVGEVFDVAVDIRQGVSNLWKVGRRSPFSRKPPPALGPTWFCPRLLRYERVG